MTTNVNIEEQTFASLLSKEQILYRTQIEFALFHLQSLYWERLVRSRYMMVIQASERMLNVDRSNSNSYTQCSYW